MSSKSEISEIFENAKKNVVKKKMNLFKGREIVDVEVEGIDMSDYPKLCDAHISRAMWGDTGEELTDTEIEELNENYEFVSEKAHECVQGMYD